MAIPPSRVPSASRPADNILGVTGLPSGRNEAPTGHSTGQPSLTVELPAGSPEGTPSGEALLRQAHQDFHKAQQSLAAAYAEQGLAVPPSLQVRHRRPKPAVRTARDTPLRVSATAGTKEPSPAHSSGLSVRTNPYAVGGAPKRSAVARGLQFSPPRVRRTYRPVSQDLPFSLVTGEPAGALNAGYRDDASVLADIYQHAAYVDALDERHHDLSPKLRAAGALSNKVSPLTTLPPRYAPQKATLPESSTRPSPLRTPRPVSGPSGRADGAVPSETGELQQEDLESEEPESPASYDRADMDKLLVKERPAVLDLDDSSSVQFFCIRYETVCLRHGADPDFHIALIESRLQQGSTSTYQEKTRLWAVLKYSQQARYESGDLDYWPFKAVLSQVAGGERVLYTRKTLSSLSQKASGSFDRFLSDFETQCAYVLPSDSEKLELFQGGLLPSLRNRVLARPDGSEWTSWFEFLTTCKRLADAELRSHELPAKALETVSAAAAATLAKGKRPRPSSEPQPKRLAKKTKPPANSSRQPQPQLTAAQRAENDARTRVISRWCRERKLCYHCLEPTHTADLRKDNKGKTQCTRRRVRGAEKWGQSLADATQAELASAGSSRS